MADVPTQASNHNPPPGPKAAHGVAGTSDEHHSAQVNKAITSFESGKAAAPVVSPLQTPLNP